MLRRLSAFAPLLALLVTVLVTFGGVQKAANTITLPIEVLGGDNHTESVTVQASDVSSVDRIWFLGYSMAHPLAFVNSNPGLYDEPKAEVRLNGGPWVGVTNDNVTCDGLEASRLECVQGPRPVTRFSISTNKLGAPTSGSNTLEFRFNYTPGSQGSGYYILGMAFLRSGESSPSYTTWKDAGAIDGTSFSMTDPQRWTAPENYDTQADIDAGKALWGDRNILIEYPNGERITASCADCHTKSGKDMEVFSFSNNSIIKRSTFHGLSESEGRQIAAYIRSLPADRVSRPWQPTYQPGPTISSPHPDCDGLAPDEAPEKCWVAGAGLEWVLDDDMKTLDHLFPDGITNAAGEQVASTQGYTNMREIPVAMMYPDWNLWLPEVHPLDASAWSESDFTNHEVNTYYENGGLDNDIQQGLSGNPSQVADAFTTWYQNSYQFRKDHIRKRDDPNDDKFSYQQWKSVKLWEKIRGLESLAPQIYKNGEARSWLGADRTIFEVSPHIHKARQFGEDGSAYDLWLDSVWYDLQMVLNAGNKAAQHPIRPMDWKYHLSHTSWSDKTRPPMRYYRSYIKQNQMLDVGDDNEGLRDWYWRHSSHRWLFARRGPTAKKAPLQSVDPATATKLYTAAFKAYMDRILRVPTDDWPRGSGNDVLPGEGYVPDPDRENPRIQDQNYPEHFHIGLQWLEEVGVRHTLLDSAYTWAGKMWPRGNDESAMGNHPTWNELNPCNNSSTCVRGPSVSLTAPSGGDFFTAPASITMTADASAPDGSVAHVRFYVDGTALTTDKSAPFEYTWSDVAAGSYSITAEVKTDAGQTQTSQAASISVYDGTTAVNGVNYEYYEGVWSQLPDYGALSPLKTGKVSSFDLSPREREESFGFRYVTYVQVMQDDYTFYLTSDDGSALYVDDALVADNDGTHGMKERSGTVSLTTGWHKIVVEYFEATQDQGLQVDWASTQFGKTAIPSDRLFLSPGDESESQTIALETGWNTISSHVAPSDSSLDQVFSDADALVMVKNEEGDAYIPSEGVDQIDNWDVTEGYLVYVETDQSISVSGSSVETTASISLADGWNIVPFYPRSSMTVAMAFEPIRSNLVMVKDDEGQSYIPSLGVNTIGEVVPGEGYEVYVTSPVTLTYPAP